MSISCWREKSTSNHGGNGQEFCQGGTVLQACGQPHASAECYALVQKVSSPSSLLVSLLVTIFLLFSCLTKEMLLRSSCFVVCICSFLYFPPLEIYDAPLLFVIGLCEFMFTWRVSSACCTLCNLLQFIVMRTLLPFISPFLITFPFPTCQYYVPNAFFTRVQVIEKPFELG